MFAALIKDFVDETRPLANTVVELIVRWEGQDDRQEREATVRAMRSALHSIKGNAAMMGLQPIEALAHALEDCTLLLEPPESQRSQFLLEGADLLLATVAAAAQGDHENARVTAFLQRVPKAGESIVKGPSAVPLTHACAGEEAQVRLPDREVDELLDLTAEALISHTELVRLRNRLRDSIPAGETDLLDEVLARLGRATAESRRRLMRVRLAPISTMFRRYARYLRDLSRERGQAIDLVIRGGDTVVDRAIIGRLFEPLVHMVRNAVAHGIESPVERQAAGKPASARILLSAHLFEGRVRIMVADDGRGLSYEAIRHKARAWALDPDNMDEAELRRLIFQPGFSTAAELSTLAGRGVGLDVVATLVQSLGGSIDVRSVVGQGTVFVIDLPVTTSLCKALVFEVGGEAYAVPAGFVRDNQIVDDETIGRSQQGRVWRWRGEELRVVEADRLLGCSGMARTRGRPYGIVVDVAGKRCVLLADRLLNVQEIVVKPLDKTLGESGLISGVTVLGQGRVVPVLECSEILRRVGRPSPPVSPKAEEVVHAS